MIEKLKEKGVSIVKNEVNKHEGLKQKVEGVANKTKSEVERLGLEQKANDAINAVKAQADKYGIQEKATKALKGYNNVTLALKVLMGLFIIIAIIGIATENFIISVVFGLLIVPMAIVLVKLSSWKKKVVRAETAIRKAKGLYDDLTK
ncbi:MAG: hypothetical protein FWC20_11320 [Oscillospiraceae bacterium]|nr:hypothetical protein [Oscillospiraceae bacterium]MCL2279976.1 hypothetical protein [Oscillospiraceae bacterium]